MIGLLSWAGLSKRLLIRGSTRDSSRLTMNCRRRIALDDLFQSGLLHIQITKLAMAAVSRWRKGPLATFWSFVYRNKCRPNDPCSSLNYNERWYLVFASDHQQHSRQKNNRFMLLWDIWNPSFVAIKCKDRRKFFSVFCYHARRNVSFVVAHRSYVRHTLSNQFFC